MFDLLTSAFYFHSAKRSNCDLLIAENGLFQRYDSVSSIGHHLMNVTCQIGLDHLDWLPKNDRTIERIIFEKTSSLLNSNIIVAKQSTKKITNIFGMVFKGNIFKRLQFGASYWLLICKRFSLNITKA